MGVKDGREEFLHRWLDATPKRWGGQGSTLANNREWCLGASWEDALTMAKEGWRDGVSLISAKLNAVVPATVRVPRWGYAESGSSVSVGRFLTGHPKNMRSRRKRESGSAKVLHIVVNGNASCAVTGEQMANYGVALVGLINRLERSGRRVHLDVCYAAALKGNTRASYGWTVKTPGQPIDLSAVAFSIGHPAAFRRLGFAMMERMPKECESLGYGFAADIQEEDLIRPVRGAMLIDGVNHEPKRCANEKDALRLAIEQINKAAVLAGHATVDVPLIRDDDFLYTD